MKIIIHVQGRQIEVQLVPHAVRITTDKELADLLRNNVKTYTAELASSIKSEYQKKFNSEFKVSNRSMSVEIWGHAYADQMAKWIQKFSRLKLINKFTDKIIFHAKLIDIGERGHDSNRIVWDCLGPFLSLIAFFLP